MFAMKNNALIVLFTLLFALPLAAQQSDGSQPYTWSHPQAVASLPLSVVSLPAIDLEALHADDALNDPHKDQPYRFGVSIPVSISPQNDGEWTDLPNGARLWRVVIQSKAARHLSLHFAQYHLPVGGRLYLYNPSHSSLLGAFTQQQQQANGRLSTAPVRGGTCIVEYYQPANTPLPQLHIDAVVHAYRGFGALRDFNDSGSCNNNINCPEAANWQSVKHSVALIISGGYRSCSGALINNVRNDCTPYFLTANHCFDADVEDWVFVFNYESPNCNNIDGQLSQAVSGCTVKARLAESDFLLLQLNQPLPTAYSPYYAGFDANPAPAQNTTCIHHPQGDIKKITFNTDPPESGSFGGDGNTHWHIHTWEDGTTEPGSSGSPLFNQNQQIVGQLHGGDAYCAYNFDDYFGKVAHSWSSGNTPAKRLRDWLDPDNTGTMAMAGRSCTVSEYALEAALNLQVAPPPTICPAQLFTPQLRLTNNGNEPIVYALFDVILDGQLLYQLPWYGELLYTNAALIDLGGVQANIGQHYLQIAIAALNTQPTDALPADNGVSSTFEVVEGQVCTLTLTTDNAPEETSFELIAPNGTVLYQQNILTEPNSTYVFDYCLAYGCYTLRLRDSWGDGITNGSYQVVAADGRVLVQGNGSFSTEVSTPFCFQDDVVVANWTSTSPNSICVGGALTFTPQASPNTNEVQWFFEGGDPSSTGWVSSNQSISVHYAQAGSYDVQMIARNNSSADTLTQTAYVQVQAPPLVSLSTTHPSLSNANGSISAAITAAHNNYTTMWSNGSSTANLADLTAGSYTLTVTDALGCVATAQATLLPTTNSPDGVVLLPIPTEQILQVFNNNPTDVAVSISIYNVLGQRLSEPLVLTNGNNLLHLNRSSMASGVYIAQIQVGNNLRQQRFVYVQ